MRLRKRLEIMGQLTVTSVTEMTIDGRLSVAKGVSSKTLFDFYGTELSRWFHAERSKHDLIMVGAGTVRCDDPELTVRHVEGPSPIRVVPTSSGDLPNDAAIFTDGRPTILLIPEDLQDDATAPFTRNRDCVSLIRAGEGVVDLRKSLEALEAMGFSSLMVEGGSRLLTSLFASDLIDRIIVKHIPVVTGAPDAPSFLSQAAGDALPNLSRWTLDTCNAIGGVAVTTYLKSNEMTL